MLVISKRDLSDVQMDTLTKSCSESFAMKTDIVMSGPTVKNHISFIERYSNTMLPLVMQSASCALKQGSFQRQRLQT